MFAKLDKINEKLAIKHCIGKTTVGKNAITEKHRDIMKMFNETCNEYTNKLNARASIVSHCIPLSTPQYVESWDERYTEQETHNIFTHFEGDTFGVGYVCDIH